MALPEVEVLFRACKHEAMMRPARSERVKDFMRSKYPGKDPHHVFGSLGSLKSTDYAIVPVDRKTHTLKQDDRSWLVWQLPMMLRFMFDYISHLEKLLEKHGTAPDVV